MTPSADKPARKVPLWKSDPKRDAALDKRIEKDIKKDELRDLVARLRSGEKLTDKEKARAKKLLAEAWAGKLT